MYPYKSIISWDPSSRAFVAEGKRNSIFPYLFVNFGLIGGITLPVVLIYIYNAISGQDKLSVLEFLSACQQLCFGVAIILTACGNLRWSGEMTTFLNKIVIFEEALGKKRSSIGKASFERHSLVVNLDAIGILASFTIAVFAIIQPTAPWVLMWLDLDFVFLSLKNIIPDLNFTWWMMFQFIRSAMIMWICLEVCSCLRMFGLTFLLLLRGLQVILKIFACQAISTLMLKELRKLQVLFAVVREYVALLLLVYLSLIYATLVVYTTVLIARRDEVPWPLQLILVLGLVLATTFLVTLLSLVVSIDQLSSKVQNQWANFTSSAM